MAKALNQTQAQKIVLENGFVQSTGNERLTVIEKEEIGRILFERGEIFKDEWIRVINQKGIVASGDIERDLTFYLEEGTDTATLYIKYPEYAKFVDRGVKGVRSSKNAPDSPYKFKNYGMSAEGRASLKKWLTSGKAKVSSRDVQKYGAVRTEKKFKKISEADSKLNTLIYNIKKYGIKKRNFITPVVEKSFQGFEQELAEAIGKKVSIVILT